jgi:hypothetical protein
MSFLEFTRYIAKLTENSDVRRITMDDTVDKVSNDPELAMMVRLLMEESYNRGSNSGYSLGYDDGFCAGYDDAFDSIASY